MKRLLVFTAIILIVLSLLSACATVTPNQKSSSVDTTENLKPVYYLLDDLGNRNYGVYEFQLNGKHCIVIADVNITPHTDNTEAAPSLSCN